MFINRNQTKLYVGDYSRKNAMHKTVYLEPTYNTIELVITGCLLAYAN